MIFFNLGVLGDEMNPREVSQLRGLLGSLQWPAVQSSPHVQCSTSLISGSMSAGLVKSIVDANKLLRFCKENADVGARYEPLGELSGLRLVCMFDAAFGVRRDSSSQGGHLIICWCPRRPSMVWRCRTT